MTPLKMSYVTVSYVEQFNNSTSFGKMLCFFAKMLYFRMRAFANIVNEFY